MVNAESTPLEDPETGKSTLYVDIANYVEMYVTDKSIKESTKETLRRVHIFINNAKRNLLGNYPKITGEISSTMSH